MPAISSWYDRFDNGANDYAGIETRQSAPFARRTRAAAIAIAYGIGMSGINWQSIRRAVLGAAVIGHHSMPLAGTCLRLGSKAARDRGAGTAEAGSDAVLNARDQCLRTLPIAPAGIGVVAQIRLGIDGAAAGGEDEDAFVTVKLIYDAPSRAPDGKIVVEAFPAQCTLTK